MALIEYEPHRTPSLVHAPRRYTFYVMKLPSPTMVVAIIALVAAVSGVAGAAGGTMITTKMLADNSVTRAKIAPNSINTAKIEDGSIQSKDLASNIRGERGVQGPKGDPGEAGSRGPAGDKGSAGETGSAGPTGPAGATGSNGPAGATGPTGPAGPSGAAGANGVQGVAGADGRTILNGTTNPSNGIGANGDFFINTATNTLFGPKAGGAWPTGTSLVGPAGTNGLQGAAGADGQTILNGTSNPTSGTGANGDFYINTTTNTLFGPKAAGAWAAGTSLVGATGATGATGSAGASGVSQAYSGALVNAGWATGLGLSGSLTNIRTMTLPAGKHLIFAMGTITGSYTGSATEGQNICRVRKVSDSSVLASFEGNGERGGNVTAAIMTALDLATPTAIAFACASSDSSAVLRNTSFLAVSVDAVTASS
jgi:hypothetical protein